MAFRTTLCSFFVPPQPLEGKDMVSEAHRLLNMRGPPTNELLNMWLHSRVHLPKGLRLKIRDGIKQPKRLMIPHPPCDPKDLSSLKALLWDTLVHLPIPKILQKYFLSITSFVARRSCTVRDLLCTKGTKSSWEQLKTEATGPCSCHECPSTLNRVNGCVAVRSVGEVRKLLPRWAPLLNQILTNAVLGEEDQFLRGARGAVQRLIRACPHMPPEWKPVLQQQVVSGVKELYSAAVTDTPSCLHRTELQCARRDIDTRFVVLPLDKNGGKGMVMCKRLYAQLLLQHYGDDTQFELLHDATSRSDAEQYAQQYLYTRACTLQLQRFFKLGRRYGPPSTFVLVRNKSMEREGEGLKLRLVFSYFNHPMKQYAKHIGQCLNVLLEEARTALHTFEMTKVHDIVQWAHDVNACTSCIALKKPQGDRTHKKASFFEFDVKEMFPRLRRGDPEADSKTLYKRLTDGKLPPRSLGVWESVNLIARLLREAKGLRACNGPPWFGIGDKRQLDVIRKAYGERAVNIPWQEVQLYVQFDVFHNDCLVLVTRMLRQKRGVPIGGMLSAQLACLYCMLHEH